jgi:hypothetical protein
MIENVSDIYIYIYIYIYIIPLNLILCFSSLLLLMGIQLFNNLPLELKRISDFKSIKSKLKTYLLQNPFYSLQEFFLCN